MIRLASTFRVDLLALAAQAREALPELPGMMSETEPLVAGPLVVRARARWQFGRGEKLVKVVTFQVRENGRPWRAAGFNAVIGKARRAGLEVGK